jgi:hypothetical protein
MDGPAPALSERVRSLLGKRPNEWRRATGGYTMAERWIAAFDDGSSCFIKSGPGYIAEALRAEFHLMYSRFDVAFLPQLLGWDDDGEQPLLILEDLSHARWPPPWRMNDVERVLEVLEQLHNMAVDGLPTVEDKEPSLCDGWVTVAAEPAPFLALGLTTRQWLEAALPSLIQASAPSLLRGPAVLHFDVRSDNLCFTDGRVVLVDWNHVCRGNPALDLAAWAPSLHSEGGPVPEDLLPGEPGLAAIVSGYFAARAGLPPIWQAPDVRTVQMSQLRSALPWCARAMGLDPPDGPNAP